jgi:hypothetical protein
MKFIRYIYCSGADLLFQGFQLVINPIDINKFGVELSPQPLHHFAVLFVLRITDYLQKVGVTPGTS